MLSKMEKSSLIFIFYIQMINNTVQLIKDAGLNIIKQLVNT